MSEDTRVGNLIINKLTKAQYEAATKSETALYMITDEEYIQTIDNTAPTNGNISLKTINNNEIVGSGNIEISEPSKISDLEDDTATNPIDKADTLTGLTASVSELNYSDGVTSNIQDQLDDKQPNLTSANAGTNITISGSGSNVVISSTGGSGSSTWGSITGTLSDQTDLQDELDDKQDVLVSGTNIKTINNNSLLGSGNISITEPTKISDLTDDTATNPIDKADTLTGLTASVSELNTLDGVTATTTELNYCDGVTSNIQTQLDSKADISASNFNSTGKSVIAGYAMPGSRYTDLTVGASGSTYTAPANGYFYIYPIFNNTGWASLSATVKISTQTYGGTQNYAPCFLPVREDETMTLTYSGVSSWPYFRFIYAQGEN